MNKTGHSASHRRLGEPQIEICEVSGLPVEVSSLKECDVEGLRGRAVCDKFPWLKKVRSKPSFNDLRRYGGRSKRTVPRRLPPYGGEEPDWRP